MVTITRFLIKICAHWHTTLTHCSFKKRVKYIDVSAPRVLRSKLTSLWMLVHADEGSSWVACDCAASRFLLRSTTACQCCFKFAYAIQIELITTTSCLPFWYASHIFKWRLLIQLLQLTSILHVNWLHMNEFSVSVVFLQKL